MAARKLLGTLLIYAFSLHQSATCASFKLDSSANLRPVYAALGQTRQLADDAAKEREFQRRRYGFTTGRNLLLDKHVPFEPEELLRDDWPRKLKKTLDAMPEMHEARYETAPLKGAYLADTLYLPEKVQLTDHTIIVVNYLVFEGKKPVIRGPHNLQIFSSKPIGVLGMTVAQALAKKGQILNVKLGGKPALPSFSLISDLNQLDAPVTFDISGVEPEYMRKPARKRVSRVRGASWKGLGTTNLQDQDTSGDVGKTGAPGNPHLPAQSGMTPPKAGNGVCPNPNGLEGLNGEDGADGDAFPDADGGPGGAGGNAGDQGLHFIADGETRSIVYRASGGDGGQGGPGAEGQRGGDGAVGGEGGDGVVCDCVLGAGGEGGAGGTAGKGGAGGNGGEGGPGGNGGTITVSIPWNYSGLVTYVTGGNPGPGGEPGGSGLSGNAAFGGAGGRGGVGCGGEGVHGNMGIPSNAVVDGQSGARGPVGTLHGKDGTVNLTIRTPPSGGDEGGDPDLFSPTCASPVLIDTAGEGFKLTSANDGVVFDIRGDGHPLHMAWIQAGSRNGFLALDRNHNEKIDSGAELFGNFTPQPASPSPNGFLALSEFDKPENGGNADGVIDSRDAVFSHLVIWIDENHDGISQPNELHTLPELGIDSLSLAYREARRVDEFGNQFRYRAKVNPDSPESKSDAGRWAFDVFFVVAKP